ncbi:MAG: capsid cement protein [Planctomycetota bacterium]
MSQYVETPTRTFTAGAAIAAGLRVKLTAGKLAVAGVADKEIGTLEAASFADGDARAVRLRNAQGTRKMVANGAISQGAAVFTAAGGKVGPSIATAFLIGTALEAASADGDVIEVLPNVHGDTAAI